MANVSPACWKEWISKKAVANAGVVVINSSNQVLLLYKQEEDEWGIPSGGIDKGDNKIVDAALRELREEAGIDLSKDKLTEIGTFIAHHPDNYSEPKTDVIVTFLAYSDDRVKLGNEHTEYDWYSLCQVLPSMHPTTRKQLERAREVVGTHRSR